MLTFASAQEKFDYWKDRIFNDDEAKGLEATAMLVEVANKSKDLRRECADLMAARLEKLHASGGDLFFTLKAVSDLSRGIISSSEPLMLAIMRIPIKDSYALNMATGIFLYEMSQGFIKPEHALEKQVMAMASEILRTCKGDARRNAMQILKLAQGHSRCEADVCAP